jgi:extracellular elastinolytic metalloproteinase
MYSSPRRRRARRIRATMTAAMIATAAVSLAPPAQGQDRMVAGDDRNERIYRNDGKALGRAGDSPEDAVRALLAARGLSRRATSSLGVEGSPWRSRGVVHLRMEQAVDGFRVYGSYVKAALKPDGRVLDVIENVAEVPAAGPRPASVNAEDALRAAVRELHPGQTVSTTVTGRSGKTVTFARNGLFTEPSVEQVVVPTEIGGLAVGYVVETWTADDNHLHETLVSGDGTVVESVLRTAEDGYRIFDENPADSDQRLVSDPADATASPDGWLAGLQSSVDISGNNAHAYLDTDNDNAPDSGGAPVDDGLFDATFDAEARPSTAANREAAVQNLFYVNNLIHDTLYRAGFTEEVGNFQADNFGRGGRDGDPVQAQAQDGGGYDNANFATPGDGKLPRMQMYLWSVAGMYQVSVPGGPAAGTYDAAAGDWAQVTEDGLTGPLALADDGTVTTTDACERIRADLTGTVAIVDRGTCPFITKAANVQDAGAAGMIVANNLEGAPFAMGGEDRKVTIPSLMVSLADGVRLKSSLGSPATLRQDPTAIMRDGDLDSDIVWHEYGHGLTWRMIGRMDGAMSGAIGEGMSDVLALIANGDDRVGEYSSGDPLGIRSEPYTGYSRSYGDLDGTSVHRDGEVYAAIGWDLLQRYDGAGIGGQALLADLVDGMNYTPAQPSFEEMRDGILAGLAARGAGETRSCLVWDAFATFGVGEAATGSAKKTTMLVSESFLSPCSGDLSREP